MPTDTVEPSETRRRLAHIAGCFLLLCIPSLALRWVRTDPLAAIPDPRLRWIRKVLGERAGSLRMVLVGSSRIWCGIDAQRLSRALYGNQTAVVNAGSNWSGRGRDLAVVGAALEHTRTEAIVIEVPPYEGNVPHPYFHRLFTVSETAGDLVRTTIPQALSFVSPRASLSFMTSATLIGLVEGYADSIHRSLSTMDEREFSAWDAAGGSLLLSGSLQGPPALLKAGYVPGRFDRAVYYLGRIADLCRARRVRLILCVLPNIHTPGLTPAYRRLLARLGTLVEYRSPRVIDDPRFWVDETHLNREGARRLTDYFIDRMLVRR